MPTLESINYLKNNELKICQMYEMGTSSNNIANTLNISPSSVLKILHKNSIIIKDRSTAAQIYSVNENIFEIIDSHEKAYWIGFLVADGFIHRGTLKLALAIKDIEHLEVFKKFIMATHPINIYKSSNGLTSLVNNKKKSYYNGIIGISNKKLIQDVAKYSITKNKSFTVEFGKNIPKKYLCSYMAGLVDGDGFITISNNKIHFGFVSHPIFAMDFQKTLIKMCNLKENKLVKSGKINVVRYAGKQVQKILEFIYSHTTIFLKRKKDKLKFFQ